MKTHTLRGRVDPNTVKRLVVDDGRFTHAMRIVGFHVAGDPTSSAGDCYAALSTTPDFPIPWDWSDNRQVAWAAYGNQDTPGHGVDYSIIDPDRVIVSDLYIRGDHKGGGATNFINYMVILEAVTITEDEAVLQLIKERAQDDLR